MYFHPSIMVDYLQNNYLFINLIKLILLGTTFVVEDKFEYIKQIGHGAYGVVCSAYDHKSKVKVAIKKIPKAFEDLIDAKRIVREIKLLSTFIYF
jgi:serine/threonine protein kinase